MNNWPYNRAMRACRKQRELRNWYNRVFTSERIVNWALIIVFFTMVYLYVWGMR